METTVAKPATAQASPAQKLDKRQTRAYHRDLAKKFEVAEPISKVAQKMPNHKGIFYAQDTPVNMGLSTRIAQSDEERNDPNFQKTVAIESYAAISVVTQSELNKIANYDKDLKRTSGTADGMPTPVSLFYTVPGDCYLVEMTPYGFDSYYAIMHEYNIPSAIIDAFKGSTK